jgi:hypothetical protein
MRGCGFGVWGLAPEDLGFRVCGRTSLVAGDLLRAFERLDPRQLGSGSRGFLVAGTEPRRKLGFCRYRSDAASVAFMSCRRSKGQKLFPVRSFRSIIYNTFSVLGQRPNPNRPLLLRETEEKCVCVMPPFFPTVTRKLTRGPPHVGAMGCHQLETIA